MTMLGGRNNENGGAQAQPTQQETPTQQTEPDDLPF